MFFTKNYNSRVTKKGQYTINPIQVQNGKIIIDQQQALPYVIAVGVLIVLIIIIAIAVKTRRKNFIKTVPTNIKDEL